MLSPTECLTKNGDIVKAKGKHCHTSKAPCEMHVKNISAYGIASTCIAKLLEKP
jgi:hypothetical protein